MLGFNSPARPLLVEVVKEVEELVDAERERVGGNPVVRPARPLFGVSLDDGSRVGDVFVMNEEEDEVDGTVVFIVRAARPFPLVVRGFRSGMASETAASADRAMTIDLKICICGRVSFLGA